MTFQRAAAGGERVRRDDLEARFQEVVPGPELLGIAVAHDEDHERARHHALPRVLAPVRSDELLLSDAMSGASENATTSASRPDATARLCSPDAPYNWENETPLPAADFWKAGISCP